MDLTEKANSETSYGPAYGALVILDALGSRSASVEQSIGFLRLRDELINSYLDMEQHVARAHSIDWEQSHVSPRIPHIKHTESISRPKAYTFGDTVILEWRLDKQSHSDSVSSLALLRTLGANLAPLIIRSLELGIMWRGSISIGDYVTDGSSSVIGPAVTEAAEWYDKIKLVGVCVAPKTGLKLSLLNNSSLWEWRPESESDPPFYFGCDMPTQTSLGLRNLWLVAWPAAFIDNWNENARPHDTRDTLISEAQDWLITQLDKHSVPLGSEDKYFNTIDFFNRQMERWREAVQSSRG